MKKPFNEEMKSLFDKCKSLGLELEWENMYLFSIYKNDENIFSCNFLEQLETFLMGYEKALK